MTVIRFKGIGRDGRREQGRQGLTIDPLVAV